MATNERDLEREEVELVFGLTNGELEENPWAGNKYWYEGVPVNSGDDFADEPAENVQYRTVVTEALYSSLAQEIEEDAGTFKLVHVYENSGEVTCPGASDQDRAGLVTEYRCPLCEETEGNKHGYINLGEGWVEAVYCLELSEERENEDG